MHCHITEHSTALISNIISSLAERFVMLVENSHGLYPRGNICGSLACVPQCPSVSPTSDEKSYQHHRWGYSVQTHSPDNFINEYFCTNISTRLEWLLGWAQVFIQLAALPALHVKSLALGTLSLLSVTTTTGLYG